MTEDKDVYKPKKYIGIQTIIWSIWWWWWWWWWWCKLFN